MFSIDKTKYIVSLGELMLKLTPPKSNERLLRQGVLHTFFGGAEANVSVSLAVLGRKSRYATKLPDNAIGLAALDELTSLGIDARITFGGDRIGVYYMEKGEGQRSPKVIYDRKNSSFSSAEAKDFDYESIFNNCGHFHFTGITPALGENAAANLLQSCKAAKSAGLTVSCDVNYREKLWGKDEFSKGITELLPYTDLLIANERHLQMLLGMEYDTAPDAHMSSDKIKTAAEILNSKYGIKVLAVTFRQTVSANINIIKAALCEGGELYTSSNLEVTIIERSGGGDAFTAGLLYALGEDWSVDEKLSFALKAEAAKHAKEGDFNLAKIDEINAV